MVMNYLSDMDLKKKQFIYESTRFSDREIGGLLKFSRSKIWRNFVTRRPSAFIWKQLFFTSSSFANLLFFFSMLANK